MKNEAFEKFLDEGELPTMSQFATKLACDAARERAFFDAGFAAGRAAENANIVQYIIDQGKLSISSIDDKVYYITDDDIAVIRARK